MKRLLLLASLAMLLLPVSAQADPAQGSCSVQPFGSGFAVYSADIQYGGPLAFYVLDAEGTVLSTFRTQSAGGDVAPAGFLQPQFVGPGFVYQFGSPEKNGTHRVFAECSG